MLAISASLVSLSNSLEKKLTTAKNLKPKNIRTIKVTPEIEKTYTSFDKDKIEKKKLGIEICDFATTITKVFSEQELENFYRNINNVKIKKGLFFKACAYYAPLVNKIVVKKSKENSLYHELFHLASSKVDGKNLFVGFCQYQDGNVVGLGLNEGYTELLNRRYFKNHINPNSYNVEVLITTLLESIVTKEKMEYFYLTSDLKSLLKELQKYNSNIKIMHLVADLDYLNKYLYSEPKKHQEILSYKLEKIISFLKETYINKLKSLNILNENTVVEMLNFSEKLNLLRETGAFFLAEKENLLQKTNKKR